MKQTIGMTGPICVSDFREFIDASQWSDDLPKGQGGTPVNLLCRELLRRGHKLVVFSCDSAVTEEIILHGPQLRLCLGPKGKRPARNFFRTERKYLAAAIAREKPDLIHAQWTYEYAMPVQVSGIPHVVTAHDTPLLYLYHNFIPYRVARTLMAYRVISRASRIVSVSPYVDRHLRTCMLYRGPTEVIPNGMPEESFSQSFATERAADRPITFMSILVDWGGSKNGQAALTAFARMRRQEPDARLIMFGSGHGPGEEAQVWAAQQGIEAGVEFVGQRPYPEVMHRLAVEADVLVHPSLLEAQPMALLEAMVRGVPVIGGERSGGVAWTLDNGRAGLLVDARSPHAIADAMLKLARSPELREHLAKCALSHLRRRFHISVVADAYEEIYQQLVQ